MVREHWLRFSGTGESLLNWRDVCRGIVTGVPGKSVERTCIWLRRGAKFGKDVLGTSKASAIVVIVVIVAIVVRVIAGLRRGRKIFIFEADNGVIRIWVPTYGSPTDRSVVGAWWIGR